MNEAEPPSPQTSAHSSLFRIGRDSHGHWVVQDQQGLRGGLFVGKAEALKFAMFENGNRPQAIIMDARAIAWTKALSALSCAMPALPGLTNSRVMVNTLGTDELPIDLSCAAAMQLQEIPSDTANRVRLNLFMDANLLVCE